jgi:hypothetical protein
MFNKLSTCTTLPLTPACSYSNGNEAPTINVLQLMSITLKPSDIRRRKKLFVNCSTNI